jgi:hypothetical protein
LREAARNPELVSVEKKETGQRWRFQVAVQKALPG